MQMLPIIIVAIVLLIVLIVIWIVKDLKNVKYTKVKVSNYTVNAELADDIFKMTKGLMGRDGLRENQGMLFVFSNEDYHRFWMMNMSMPIDIIFANRNKTVVDIWQDAQPCGLSCSSYSPQKPAMYVLEVKANFTERHNVRTGSKLSFDIE